MRLFKTKLILSSVSSPERVMEFEGLVDTGATMSFVPAQILEFLQSPKLGRMKFRCADGRIIERQLGLVIGRHDSRQAGFSVAFAEADDEPSIGVTALESLGLTVDPVQQKLIPTVGLALESILRNETAFAS